ncbi:MULTISPECIES: GNAT family N-acetyltransferase [Burkholderia]|uniref:GNAT family N-acetyltransferase n=1 Tax=Burkholderia TaxID=32008 RepID=UPI00117810CD|nr:MULTISPECIES: GNAT family N-acetyltransferase [Burkholderia]EKS9798232.1 hypothetical protein [Burkholderia cepacia]EKS9808379.1 hypothetical protein [Burkholderia cepacia]EKS9815989.1 hypothetical protein [Burkholderia cepacia]EKS9823583.1 hypothetical protein [Burkholderia cepacia]EKS9827311.1 hypothetical protein [Burkholderia cepacia]
MSDCGHLESIVLEVLREQFPVDHAAVSELMARFDLHPVLHDDEIVGVVAIDGPEIHISVLPAGRRLWASRSFIRQELGGVIERYGRAETTVRASNLAGLNFCARLGFRRTSEVDGVVHMTCEATV